MNYSAILNASKRLPPKVLQVRSDGHTLIVDVSLEFIPRTCSRIGKREERKRSMVEHYPGTTPGQSGSNTQAGQQVTDQAKQQSQQLAHQARQQASELVGRGTEQAKGQLANQKHEASQRLVPVQTALRESAQQLRKQGQGSVGHYADRAADRVERISTYLRETEVDEIMEEVRGFARRRPGLFLGSAAAIGFFATRFLKSSSEEQGSSAGDGSSTGPAATSPAAITHGTQEPPATALPPSYAEERSGQPPNVAEGELDRETDLRRSPRDLEVE
jgi:hypothetical protein